MLGRGWGGGGVCVGGGGVAQRNLKYCCYQLHSFDCSKKQHRHEVIDTPLPLVRNLDSAFSFLMASKAAAAAATKATSIISVVARKEANRAAPAVLRQLLLNAQGPLTFPAATKAVKAQLPAVSGRYLREVVIQRLTSQGQIHIQASGGGSGADAAAAAAATTLKGQRVFVMSATRAAKARGLTELDKAKLLGTGGGGGGAKKVVEEGRKEG